MLTQKEVGTFLPKNIAVFFTVMQILSSFDWPAFGSVLNFAHLAI
jgi:hypothetical protein